MENINQALYQILGAILFLTAVTMLYYVDGQVNQSINYQTENLHKQKALTQK
jgi:hypothetical protein